MEKIAMTRAAAIANLEELAQHPDAQTAATALSGLLNAYQLDEIVGKLTKVENALTEVVERIERVEFPER